MRETTKIIINYEATDVRQERTGNLRSYNNDIYSDLEEEENGCIVIHSGSLNTNVKSGTHYLQRICWFLPMRSGEP